AARRTLERHARRRARRGAAALRIGRDHTRGAPRPTPGSDDSAAPRLILRLPGEHMFAFIYGVQLALDSLDRLVDTLEERGTLSVVEAARALFATTAIPDGLARSLLEEVTAGDSRVVCTGATVSLVD